jgi:ABC-type antimicrobial peptide transport system permease subunit
MFVTVRTSQLPAAVTARLVKEMHAVDPAVPIGSFHSTKAIDQTRAGEAMQLAWGAVIAGGFALALACVGLFAVVAFAVAQRSREIGIRVALGATRDQVVRRFFGEGMRMALVSFAIGVPVAIAFMRIAQSQILDAPIVAPGPIAMVVGVLFAVTALASWIPARRATRVDPIESLRSE